VPAQSNFISAAEAAARLGVHPSRVRAMVHAHQLNATKIAGRWLVDQASVDRRRDSRVADGRPYSPANAWALLRLADGQQVDWLGPSALSRLRSKLRTSGLLELAPRLRARARAQGLRGHSSALQQLALEPGVVKAGASAAADVGVSIQTSDELEAYISRARFDEIVAKYHLERSNRPNVLLRVVDDDRLPAWQGCVGRAAIALDLYESQDPRSRHAARELLGNFSVVARSSRGTEGRGRTG
jgi:excisionase family DNA binding protein